MSPVRVEYRSAPTGRPAGRARPTIVEVDVPASALNPWDWPAIERAAIEAAPPGQLLHSVSRPSAR